MLSNKITVIPVVFGALGIVPKTREKKLGELKIRRSETVKTTALLRSAKILRIVQET